MSKKDDLTKNEMAVVKDFGHIDTFTIADIIKLNCDDSRSDFKIYKPVDITNNPVLKTMLLAVRAAVDGLLNKSFLVKINDTYSWTQYANNVKLLGSILPNNPFNTGVL